VTPSVPKKIAKLFLRAVQVASGRELVVLAIGGNEQLPREAWSLKTAWAIAPVPDGRRQAEELVKAILP